MTEIKKSKQIYFLFDTKECSPNGDPDTGRQRMNEDETIAYVSDLRIKRYVRNYLGEKAFYEYESIRENPSKSKETGAAAKFDYLKRNHKGYKNDKEMLLKECMDVRAFGVIVTAKNGNFSVEGAIQFSKRTPSMNNIVFVDNGITTVFPSNTKNSQGSMGRDTFIEYGIFCALGTINANTAKENGFSKEDLKEVYKGLFIGMNDRTSRSKIGQTPIAIIEIDIPTREENGQYIAMYNHYFKPVVLKNTESPGLGNNLRNDLDFTNLINSVQSGVYTAKIFVSNISSYLIKGKLSGKSNISIHEIFED